jgi:penicillin amidase
MVRNSVAATLAVRTRDEFLRRILVARAGTELATKYRWSQSAVLVEQLLSERPAQWLPPGYQTRGWDALLVDALAAVLADTSLSSAESRWGLSESLLVVHPVFSHVPILRSFADLGPDELSGSGLTVKQITPTLGPSMRFVADFADWDRSTLTLFAGESGLLFSPYYRDEFPAYLRGVALPLWFSQAAVEAHRSHSLRLEP